MSRDLMPEQVKVNPGVGSSTNRATQNGFVKVTGDRKIVNWKGEMKGADCHLFRHVGFGRA